MDAVKWNSVDGGVDNLWHEVSTSQLDICSVKEQNGQPLAYLSQDGGWIESIEIR